MLPISTKYLVIAKEDATVHSYFHELRHKSCDGKIKLISAEFFSCYKCKKEFIFKSKDAAEVYQKNFWVEDKKIVNSSELEVVQRLVWKSNGKTLYSTLEPMTESEIVSYHFSGCQVEPLSEAVTLGISKLK